MTSKVKELLKKKYIYLDGGFGTELQKNGLALGGRPENMNITHPEIVEKIHRSYVEAGSDIISANTFGANAHKLRGNEYSQREVITAAIQIAKRAAADKALVALDIGPIGELLEPNGTLTFDEAYQLYKDQVLLAVELGADLVIVETQTDLYEVKAAILAVKENSDLPVFVSMTFEKGGRTFTGTLPESFAVTAEGLGADAIGINCSLAPEEILPSARKMAAVTELPLIIKPNAGLPDPKTGVYNVDAAEFVAQMAEFQELGVRIVGGCCGTAPDYIRLLKETFDQLPLIERKITKTSNLCTPSNFVTIDGVRVIGERINPTGKKRFKQALIENDFNYIIGQADAQAEAGAHILDVNVGLPEIDEPAMMKKAVQTIQDMVDLPLQIDSSDVAAIEQGLRYYNGKPIVNSVNGEPEVLERILPLVKKYGANVVGLTLDKSGIPETAKERFAIAKRILDAALSYGIPKEHVFIDCLTLTVSAQQAGAVETLNAMTMVRDQLGLHCVLGVSNISFGLPNRALMNHSFLMLAMDHGLDLPIMNPNTDSMMDAVFAYNVLHNADVDSNDYIARFTSEEYLNRQAKSAAKVAAGSASGISVGSSAGSVSGSASGVSAGSPADSASGFSTGASNGNGPSPLHIAVCKGMKEESARLTKEILTSTDEMTIINQLLIPALDEVGQKFESGKLFLPQLLNAAGAAGAAFEVIKTSLANKGDASVSKGKIVIATVEGDIHDIGKNIVKVILENYGYQVIDLGKDVPVEQVAEAVVREDVELVGLSALMTTTLVSMERTIKAIRATGHPCKIVVGGAVLTPDYAEQMGADYYAKDAAQTVDVAKEVFGQ